MNMTFAGEFDLAGFLAPYRFHKTLVRHLQRLTDVAAVSVGEAADV